MSLFALLSGFLCISEPVALSNISVSLDFGLFRVELGLLSDCYISTRFGDPVAADSCEQLAALLLATELHHAPVHVVQVLLLWPKNRAWACNPDPSNESRGREAEVFHAVQSNEGASSAKPGLTMDSDGTCLVLCSSEELRDNIVGWGRSV